MFSRWLVAIYDHTADSSLWLEQTCADDLDNVVVVAFPEFRDDSGITVIILSVTFSCEYISAQVCFPLTFMPRLHLPRSLYDFLLCDCPYNFI